MNNIYYFLKKKNFRNFKISTNESTNHIFIFNYKNLLIYKTI